MMFRSPLPVDHQGADYDSSEGVIGAVRMMKVFLDEASHLCLCDAVLMFNELVHELRKSVKSQHFLFFNLRS